MKTELKPCPFCGGTEIIVDNDQGKEVYDYEGILIGAVTEDDDGVYIE